MSNYRDTYREKVVKKWCPKCKGSGFVLMTTSDGYEVAKPCSCEEGQQRRNALTRSKEGE